jgi:hypothetical protein
MNQQNAIKKESNFEQPSIFKRISRRVILIYILCIFITAFVCFIFGWRSFEVYASALKYCSIGILVLGALIVAANSARTEIPSPNYFIPTRREHHESVSEHFRTRNEGLLFFLISIICSVILFGTGYLIKKLIV